MKNRTYLLLGIFFMVFIGNSNAQSDIEKIKKRVVAELMKLEVDDSRVAKLLETIKEDGTWPGINYEDVSRTGFEHRNHYANMIVLARAYKTKSSKYFKKKKAKETIELALKNWVDNDYFCDNWWHNQIGTTNGLVSLMLIIGDELNKDLVEKAQPIIGRANVDAPGARPGGDRIKISGIQAKNMLFLGDDETFNKVVRIIEGEIKFSEWVGAKYGYGFRHIPTGFSNREMGGRGIQYDNSFHHRVDGVNNTLSYGLGYADAFVEWAVYTSGTQFSFSEEKLEPLIDYFLDGICKTAVFGKYPDAGAKNRSISREGTLHVYSAKTAEKLLLTSDYRKDEIQEIVDIRNKGILPTTSHATYYWHSEHFTFQRPDFFTSVRLYSTRTHNMEQPYNSEGLFNHHRGDGTNHISRTGDEYYDIAPVFDYQKIPGTTVLQKPELPAPNEIQKLGITDFVGAATDGKYGTAAFDFRSPHDPLITRKAWFFFDEEYVCLGAGISCKTNLPVVTTLNQCLLRDDVTISSESKKWVISKGEKEFEKVDWVFQDGIGYVFPKPTSVNIKNSASKGSWWLINKQTDSPKDEVELDVFKLWLNHGESPSEEMYEYIVVPATSIEKLEQNTSKSNVEVLLNTPEIQAVKHSGLKMCQAVFYKAGEVQIIDNLKLSCQTPGIVILQAQASDGMKITVSDPNRELGKMLLSLSIKIEKQGDNFTAVWNEKEKVSEITIDLPKGNYAGKSVTIEL
ncbi:MAG: chondroitin lyase [Prolixibacteraceae bacterium]|mgnify:CR=1 FL=1|jgi:chondroitin AC lyase|nr:chondroitin lyase [Prolixibacteraceae bacterium]MBT6763065.1 chondroitin lyase [Prolixibacteraceae bacterium]MBT7000976.1 chondroitin lyase [Prolixibacteraceae bacterium]MBT7395063.1 chondroitin lyase [Prolixibacteraceae bacterium]